MFPHQTSPNHQRPVTEVINGYVSRSIARHWPQAPSEIRIEDGIAIVSPTHGLEAIVDIADVDEIAGYRWTAMINCYHGHAYAARYEGRKCILMHRQLLQAPPDKQVDHEDGDGLNNRRYNIRLATPSQNQANKAVERRNKLGVKGVCKDGGRFRATIKPDGRTIHLGRFATAEEAAAAYKGAAKVLWGDYAYK